MSLPAQVAVPQLTPGEVVTINTRRAEPGNDARPIGHRRRSAGRILVVRRFFLRPRHAGLPEQLASAPVETQHRTEALGLDGLSHENSASPYDRSGAAAVGQRQAPAD